MAEDGGGSWKGTLTNFFVGTVLATLVSTGFSYKSWREQTRLDFAKAELADANLIFDKASGMLSERTFSSYDVLLHLDDDDATHAKRLDRLAKAVDDWNLHYPDVLQHIQFALEIGEDGRLRPFHDIASHRLDALDCAQKFDDKNGDAGDRHKSPSWLFAAIHHCFLQTSVRSEFAALRKKPPPADYAARKQAVDKALDDLAVHGNEFRIQSKKAIQRLRLGVETRSYLEFLTSW